MDRFRAPSELLEILGAWSTGPGPLYRKLSDALVRAVDNGDLHPGERLPSERQLATALAVSRVTVVGAYDELRARDLLESRTGSGTRVCENMRAVQDNGRVPGGTGSTLFQRLIDGPDALISLACAADSAVSGVAEALEEVTEHDLPGLLADPGYHPRGLPALRAAIAARYTEQDLPTHPDQVLITTGAHQALGVISELFVSPKSYVLVETPSLATCLDVFRAREARLIHIPLDAEGMDVQRLGSVLEEHAPALLYVMPSYHNPTGKMMSSTRRRRIAELAARHGVTILEDNAYAGLTQSPEGDEPPVLATFAPGEAEVLTVESLGKVAWGGLRIGWVRGPASIVERCARRKALADLGSPLLDQALAARLVPRLDELAAKRSTTLRAQCELLEHLLSEHLPEWRWQRPDGGAALWVALPDVDSHVFAQLALRHGVEVVPGSAMDPTGAHDDHFRIPFTHDADVLVELVQRLVRAWTELRRHGPFDDRLLRPVI